MIKLIVWAMCGALLSLGVSHHSDNGTAEMHSDKGSHDRRPVKSLEKQGTVLVKCNNGGRFRYSGPAQPDGSLLVCTMLKEDHGVKRR